MHDRVDMPILWPSEKHYPRFRDLCTDEVLDTYEEFVRKVEPLVSKLEREGFAVIKIDFDPDDMAAWCLKRFGKVDSAARGRYATMLLLGEGPDALD